MVQGADNVVSDKRSSFRSGFVQLGWNSTTVFYGIGNCYVKEKNLSLMQHASCVSFPYQQNSKTRMKQIEHQHQELIARCQNIAISFINDTLIKCAFHGNKDM